MLINKNDYRSIFRLSVCQRLKKQWIFYFEKSPLKIDIYSRKRMESNFTENFTIHEYEYMILQNFVSALIKNWMHVA